MKFEMGDLMSYLVENAKHVSADTVQIYLISSATVKLLKAVIPDIEQQFSDSMKKTIMEGLMSMQVKDET